MLVATAANPVTQCGWCGWCGCLHGPLCPRIKAINYHPDGSVKRIEFHGGATTPETKPIVTPLFDMLWRWGSTCTGENLHN